MVVFVSTTKMVRLLMSCSCWTTWRSVSWPRPKACQGLLAGSQVNSASVEPAQCCCFNKLRRCICAVFALAPSSPSLTLSKIFTHSPTCATAVGTLPGSGHVAATSSACPLLSNSTALSHNRSHLYFCW